MSEREYDNQSITDYLLGSLPDEQAERFDELSFISEEFSQALKSVENDLIDAYLNGELSDAALEKFKNHYLSSPLRREKVNFAKSLQVYAKQNIAQAGSKTENSSESEIKQKRSFLSSLNIFANLAFGWAAAFLLIIMILGGFWIISRRASQPEIAHVRETPILSNQQSPQQNTGSAAVGETVNENSNIQQPSVEETPKKTPSAAASRTPKPQKTLTPPKPVVASFILAPPLRGGSLQTISFSRETDLIMMTLKTESNDYKAYQVTLADESNRKLWRSGNVKIRNELINISFPGNLLKSRIYTLVLSGVNAAGEAEIISNYSFRAVLR